MASYDESYVTAPSLSDKEELDDVSADIDNIPSLRRNLMEDLNTPKKPPAAVGGTNIDNTNIKPGEEHMRVYLRIRPFTDTEMTGEPNSCMSVENEHSLTMHAPKESVTYKNSSHAAGKITQRFTFSKIFPAETDQKMFFNESMLQTVKDFVGGQNCLLFAYGVTNSGKTYTIQGTLENCGIIPRTLDVVFNSIQDRQYNSYSFKPKYFSDVCKLTEEEQKQELLIKEALLSHGSDEVPEYLDSSKQSQVMSDVSSSSKMSNATAISQDSLMSYASQDGIAEPLDSLSEATESRIREEARLSVEEQGEIKFSVWVSFAEIYNEYVYDMLEAIPTKKGKKRNTLRLGEDKNGNIYIKGLKEIRVTSADEAYKVLTIGRKNLQMAATKLNHNSSRSHCIFTVKIVRVVDKDNPHMARISKLSFCDLAGSERHDKTQNGGERLKEAGNINTSLLTLGRCISTLRYNQNHSDNPKIIPFRDSKLTRLFQNFFTGKGKASMIVNVSQCSSMFDETLHVMKFSAIAKQVFTVQTKQDIAKEKPKPPSKLSIMLNQTWTPRSRATIAWETGRSSAIVENSRFNPDFYMSYIDEEGSDSEAENDTTIGSSQNQKVWDLVDKLKQMLISERKDKMELEKKIREEVSQEFAEQLVEIENEYSERMRDEREAVEDLAERRIEMYTQSVKKSRKRPRIHEDDESEMVAMSLLKDEQSKNKSLTKDLELLAKERKELKEEKLSISTARDKLQVEKSRLEFEVSTLQQAAQDLKASMRVVTNTNHNLEQQISQLHAQLQQTSQRPSDDGSSTAENLCLSLKEEAKGLNEEIALLTSEITTLKHDIKEREEMLEEAGETFKQKELEIEKLKVALGEDEQGLNKQEEAVNQLQTALEETKDAAEQANATIESKNQYIDNLQSELESTRKGLEDLEKRWKEDALSHSKTVEELKSEIVQLLANIKSHEVELADQKEVISVMEKVQHKQVSELEEVITSLKKENICKSSLHDSIMKADNVKQLQEKLTTLKADNSKLFSNNEKLASANSKFDTDLFTMSEKNAELEEKLKEHSERINLDMQKIQSENLEQIKSLECEKIVLERKLQDYDDCLIPYIRKTHEEEINELRKVNFELEENLKDYADTRVPQMERNIEMYQTQVKDLNLRIVAFSDLKEENESLTQEIIEMSALQDQNKTLLKDNLQLKTDIADVEFSLEQKTHRIEALTAELESTNSNVITLTDYKIQVENLNNKLSALQNKHDTLEEEMKTKLREDTTCRDKTISDLEAKVKELIGIKLELTDSVDCLQKDLDAQNDLAACKMRELSELGQQLKLAQEKIQSSNEDIKQKADLLQEQHDKLASTSEQYEAKMREQELTFTDKQLTLEKLVEHNERLHQETLSKAMQHMKRKHTEEIDALNLRLSQAEQLIEKQQAATQSEVTIHEELKLALETTKLQVENLENELNLKSKLKESAECELVAVKCKCSQLKTEVSNLNSRLQLNKEILQERTNDNSKLITEHRALVSALREEHKKELEELGVKLQAAITERDQLSANIKVQSDNSCLTEVRLDKAQQQLKQTQEKLDNAFASITRVYELETLVKQKDVLVCDLELKISDLQKAVSKSDTAVKEKSAELSAAQRHNEKADQNVQQLELKLNDKETQFDELKARVAQIRVLEGRLAKKECEIVDLQHAAKAADVKSDSNFEKLRKDYAAEKLKQDAWRKEKTLYDQTITELKAGLVEQDETCQLQEEVLNNRAEEIKQLQSALTETEHQVVILLDQNKDLQQSIKTLQAKRQESAVTTSSSDKQIQQLRTENANLQAERKKYEQNATQELTMLEAAKSKELDDWRKERDTLVQKLQDVLQKKSGEIQSLKQQLIESDSSQSNENSSASDLKKMLKAKELHESDLKAANSKLQEQVTLLQTQLESVGAEPLSSSFLSVQSEDVSRIELDVTPAAARRHTRSRKKQQTECSLDELRDEVKPNTSANTRRSRKTRVASADLLDSSENNENKAPKKSRRTTRNALKAIADDSSNVLIATETRLGVAPETSSVDDMPPPAASTKKKRKLLGSSELNAPLDCAPMALNLPSLHNRQTRKFRRGLRKSDIGPPLPMSTYPVLTTLDHNPQKSAHNVLTRKLRSRQSRT